MRKPWPDCPACKGVGFVFATDTPFDRPKRFNCSCPKRPKPPSEYGNMYVNAGAIRYRVAFFIALAKPMIVCRQTKHGETPIDINGPTGTAVVERARRLAVHAAVTVALCGRY
jgi:hypothetical protein